MRGIVKTFRRPPACRTGDRNGGFPRLSDSVAHVSRCPASPRRTLLAENLGKPSLWVFNSVAWYDSLLRGCWHFSRIDDVRCRHSSFAAPASGTPRPDVGLEHEGQYRDVVEKRMTLAQVSEAQKLARE